MHAFVFGLRHAGVIATDTMILLWLRVESAHQAKREKTKSRAKICLWKAMWERKPEIDYGTKGTQNKERHDEKMINKINLKERIH